MNALYLVVMLIAPPCGRWEGLDLGIRKDSCESRAEIHFTYRKADAEKSLELGARVWKIFPSLAVKELRAGSGGVVFGSAVKVK